MNAIATLETLYRPIEAPLRQAGEEVSQLWTDALELVGLADGPKPKAGGKLLRPALCLLSAGAIGGEALERYAKLAAAFEALHIASLAHDDVIDKALLRRGTSSLNALWDNHAAVLGGDYLVARAVELMAAYGSCDVIAGAITSVRRMAEGELFFFGLSDDAVTQEHCIQLAEQKTASLFAEACGAPAYLLDTAHRTTLHAFGIAFGTAFQLTDDLLDLTQPAEQLGKPSCGDIAEGKNTLPILFMREAMDSADAARLNAMRGADINDADREWAMAQTEHTGARERIEAVARTYADRALTQLAELPPTPYRDSMEGIVEFLLVRTS